MDITRHITMITPLINFELLSATFEMHPPKVLSSIQIHKDNNTHKGLPQ